MRKGICLLLIAFWAIGTMSLGMIGCGGSDEEPKSDVVANPSTPPPDEGEIATSEIDRAAEKAKLQELWRNFITGFNSFETKNVEPLWSQKTTDKFYIVIYDKEVSQWDGWASIRKGMEGLWVGLNTKGTTFQGSLSTFYIRRSEASANGSAGYISAGKTYVYFTKVSGDWKISELDSISSENVAFRKDSVLIPRYFESEKDRAP